MWGVGCSERLGVHRDFSIGEVQEGWGALCHRARGVGKEGEAYLSWESGREGSTTTPYTLLKLDKSAMTCQLQHFFRQGFDGNF